MTTAKGKIYPEIRRLGKSDCDAVVRHFCRLDKEMRRLRFGNAVNDAFLTHYANAIFESVSIVYGAWVENELRGVAEIRGLPANWTSKAEAAFSVEREWQDRGIGNALLQRLIATAQNRGIRQLAMVCLKENLKMQHLAEKYEAIMQYEVDHVEGRISDLHPTFGSIYEEFSGEARSFVRAVLTP
jgi:GNAT superfamily N-acetyltransferase